MEQKVGNPNGFPSRPIGRPPRSNQRFERDAIDMFSLISGGGRKALSFDELAGMTGRRIELVFRTVKSEWSQLGRVVRIQMDGDRRVLVYQTEDAGYGLINEYEFSDALAHPVRAYPAE